MKQVLAILPSKVLYGKERSNIEVYNLMKNKLNLHVKVAINKNANDKIKDATSNLSTYKVTFPERHRKKFALLGYLKDYIIANIQMYCLIKKTNPDVLFLCSELSFYDLYPALKLSNKKMIYRIGDEPAYKGLSFYKYNSFVWEKFVIPQVNTFICISQYIKKTVEKTGRKSQKDIIIYNYPPARKANMPDESYKYPQIQKNGIIFGYLGQIIQQKGVDLFIKAAIETLKQNPNNIFYIAGSLSYDSKYSQIIKELIPQEYSSNFILLDEISNIELFFSKIDILCVPSVKQEPLGNVLVEAKKYKKACIIFPTGGMPELITHQHNGFICKDTTVESLKQGLDYYIKNNNLIVEHNNNSFTSIEELHIDRLSFEEKWGKVIQQV